MVSIGILPSTFKGTKKENIRQHKEAKLCDPGQEAGRRVLLREDMEVEWEERGPRAEDVARK